MRASTTSLSLTGVTNLAVMAPLRTGFVPVADTITYLKRLELLLTALNAARVAARESMIGALPFPDAIGRFRMIHSFRYAVFPPKYEPPAGGDPTAGRYLTLNVTFDGGFEPYMRVIYRDLGPLLDALFSHAEPTNGYPMSRSNSFDAYCRWVRNNELPKGLFYVDSGMTLGDQRYLEGLERLQRESRDPADTDRRIAELALDSAAAQHAHAMLATWKQRERVAWHQLRALKGLHRLLPFFDCEGDRDVLWRFSRSLLGDFQKLLDQGFLDGDGLKPLRLQFADELRWLRGPEPLSAPPEPMAISRAWVPERVQAGIVDGFDGITHGALALLEVTAPAQARNFLQTFPATVQGQRPPADGIVRTLALSWSGMQRLELPAELLDHLAPEFREGMEARAGLLGDVRTNHPDHWRRPFRHGAPADAGDADRIDLDTVHVVVALRLADLKLADSGLHPLLAKETLALDNPATNGLRLLAVQPLRSWPEAASDGAIHARDHFGFLDGFSQPRPAPPGVVPPGRADDVPLGDFVLGHRNGHNDPPYPEQPNDLLDHGSYLVVRKLRQRIDRLNAQLEQQLGGGSVAAAQAAKVGILELMMGRGMDGRPLVPLPAGAPVTGNDFDYAADPTGRLCPFHSHVRRSNPRDGQAPMPRLMRRGMSYGPRVTDPANLDAERGVVFMAYCASIAEQFEVIQRWISGGNSSGVSSRHADPFMAVPEPGERRTWRIPVGTTGVRRLDLGDQPFVELEWGLYLFVPSKHALSKLNTLSQAGPANAPPHRPDVPQLSKLAWQAHLESPVDDERNEAWTLVRESQGGVLDTAYGKLVGSLDEVQKVLHDRTRSYSVRGYGKRMAVSIGHGYLGLDDPDHEQLAKGVNAVLRRVSKQAAFEKAREVGTKVLEGAAGLLALTEPGGSVKVPVDLIGYSERVLGLLCQAWFGLPNVPPPPSVPPAPQPPIPHMVLAGRKPGEHAPGDPVRCPGHLMMTSRYIFSTWPSPEVEAQASGQGQAFKRAVQAFLDDPLAKKGQLTTDVLAALPATATADDKVNTVAGVMLGFPPTVHGNFVRTITRWQETRELWALQRELQPHLVQHASNAAALFANIGTPLTKALLKAMRQQPVPETIWRLPADPDATLPVVLGLASAMKDPSAPPTLMFGGDPALAPHACPGYEMAVGVLCGMLAALLAAGQWRTTGSTMQLLLVKPGR